MDKRCATFSLTLRVSSLCGTTRSTRPGIEPIAIEGRIARRRVIRHVYAETERAREDARRDAAGAFTPCEEAYEAITRLVRAEDRFRTSDRRSPLDGRRLAEVLVLVGSTGVPWEALPSRFGNGYVWARRFRILAADGTLGAVVARLSEIDPVRYGRFARTFLKKLRLKTLDEPQA